MKRRNMTHSHSHSILLVVHNNINPSLEEWGAMAEDMKRLGGSMKGVLVYTEGGSPNAMQRKQLRDVLNPDSDQVAPMVILTTSMVARMAVTAFNLFFKNRLRAIEPNLYEEGLQYLGLPKTDWPIVMKTLDELAQTLQLKFPYQRASDAQV